MGWFEQSWNACLLCLCAPKGGESDIIGMGIAGNRSSGEKIYSLCHFATVLLGSISGWQVFLNFMNSKAPQTILTDQNVCLKKAIEKELPSTKHVLCKWLIVDRLPSWFGANLGEHYKDWKNEFDRLYNMDSTVAFDLGWNEMVNFYRLHGNEHIASLFASRNLWALPYLRGHFTAGLITLPAVSKSTNAFIQRFLSAQTHLANFIEQVSICCQIPSFSFDVDQHGFQIFVKEKCNPLYYGLGPV